MSYTSHDELRAHWDMWAGLYAREIERTTLTLARVLMEHVRLSRARAVLEVGAGPGQAARVVLENLPQEAHFVVTDLSPKMITMARKVLPARVEVEVANCEELPHADGSFDRILANLSLMLVVAPDRALAEAYRVLRPGGIAAWSVWGRPALSRMFTIPGLAAERAGIELPDIGRSNFHLGDRDQLRARILSHGFNRVLAWHHAMMFPFQDGASYADLMIAMPRWRDYLNQQPAERIAQFRRELARAADQDLSRGQPLGLDVLIAIGYKD